MTEVICYIGVAVTHLSAKPIFKLMLCVHADLIGAILTFTAIRLKHSDQANYEHLGKGLRLLALRIENQTGMWIRENDDGSAQIMSHGQPDSNWNYFKVEIYEKQERLSDQEPFIYKYVGQEDVSRCESKTKQGKRCNNRAVTDQDNCSQHMVK